MTFRITALDPEPFAALFALDDGELAARQIVRHTADAKPGFPCRVSLADAEPGETLLLVNHVHLDVASPYRASHALYIREGAARARPEVGAVPAAIACRLLSGRAFDASGLMIDADVLPGSDAGARLEAWLADPAVEHVDLHTARQGCFLARAVRA